ncbi:MAG: Fis family transcriptional regulator [Deltaproteobacteria bacterium HGW-Deltaproteobacteria-6]|nr:MAG: Fis family transcriptional regulator [Deltaproteobacteria bacterium HGW-Deltaproteobacteria-6]
MVKVLIIDDDEMFCRLLSSALKADGYAISCAYCLEEGLRLVANDSFDVVFLDVRLPDGNGLDKLSEIRESPSEPEVIILTGAGTANGAELAIHSGAWDYIQKPSSISSMTLPLIRALQYREEKLKKRPVANLKLGGLVGRSSQMKACYSLIAEAASCDANVLITGETGTGKELFAKAIHENSARAGRSFVIVDCAALTQNLTESALFGYEKGAFTGADQRREGLIRQAHGGTLFLDEIGELPLTLQKSFLRVLQEHRFRPLGGSKEIESDFRLIAATNRNLEQLVEKGLFREDLLFRLRSVTLTAPPLREHIDDLFEIAIYHTARICQRSRIEPKKLSPDFQEALLAYTWPGNVRELVNAIERAIAAALSAPTLFQKHLPSTIRIKLAQGGNLPDNQKPEIVTQAPFPTLKDLRESTYARVEKKYMEDLLASTGGDIEKACRISGLSRTRLYEILRKHHIPIKS